MRAKSWVGMGWSVVVMGALVAGCGSDSSDGDQTAVQCSDAETNCDGECVLVDEDEAHCGSCDTVCDDGQSCNAGVCEDGSAGNAGNAGTTHGDAGASAEGGRSGGAGGVAAPRGGAGPGKGGNSSAGGRTSSGGAAGSGAVEEAGGNGLGGGRGGGTNDARGGAAGSGDTGNGGSGDTGNGGSGDTGNGGSGDTGNGGSGDTGNGGSGTGGAPVTPVPASCSESFVEAPSCAATSGRTFYVSSSLGDDANDGQTEDAPIATVDAVNALTLSPGDQVRFRCGDTFPSAQLRLMQSGQDCQHIVYSSYPAPCAEGQNPTLSGRVAVSGFVLESGRVWVADLSAGQNAGLFPRGLNQVFQGEARLPMGKWPNPGELANGFSYIDRQDGAVIEDDELPAGDWTGAAVRVRTVRWLLINRLVESSNPPSLTMNDPLSCYAGSCGNPDTADASSHGYGYQLTNHRNTLDQPGEWYFDADTSLLYVVSESEPVDISASAIPEWADEDEGRQDHNGAVLLGENLGVNIHHVVVENLRIEGYFGSGISTPVNLRDDENYQVTLRCNQIENVEAIGINLATWVYDEPTLPEWYGGREHLVQGNVISGPNHFGIKSYARTSTFENNVIRDIGRLENLGRRGLGCAFEGDNCTENGDGVHLSMSSATINSYGVTFRHNRISNTAYCGVDIFGHDLELSENLLEQVCFTKADCGAVRTFGSGVTGLTIDKNIIVEPVGNVDGGGMGFDTPMAFGLYIDMDSSNVTATGNTVINAPSAGILYQNSTGTISGNTLFDTGDGGQQIIAEGATASDNIEFSTATEPNGEIFYNATESTVETSLTGSYLDLDGATVSGAVSIAPYESVILLRQ